MATLALGIAGTALGGSGAFAGISFFGGAVTGSTIFGAVGGLIGGFVDQMFTIPLISGGPASFDSNFGDIQFNTVEEGADLPYFLGPQVRVSGAVTWKDEIDVRTQRSGGGGGKGLGQGQDINQRKAFLSFEVTFGEAPDALTEMTTIYANDKVIYEGANDSGTPAADTSSSDISLYLNGGRPAYAHPGNFFHYTFCEFYAFDGSLDDFGHTERFVASGFSDPKVNREYTVVGVSIGSFFNPATGSNGTGRRLDCRVLDNSEWFWPVPDKEFPSNLEGVIDLTKTVSNNPGTDVRYGDIEVSLGGLGNTPSSIVEDIEGVGNVPAGYGMARVAIEELDLGDFGNQLPRVNAIIDAGTITTGAAIEKVLARTMMPSAYYDATACTDALLGISVEGPQPAERLIAPIMLAYDYSAREVQGQLIIEPRSLTVDWEIPFDDVIETVKFRDKSDRELPDEVIVRFADVDRNLQRGSRRERKVDSAIRQINTVDLPLSLDSQTAGSLAIKLLWTAWAQRESVEFSVGPKYLEMRPGDLVELTIDTEVFPIRVTSVTRGDNFVHEVKGDIEVEIDTTVPPDSNSTDDGGVVSPYLMEPVAFAVCLREEDLGLVGYYYGAYSVDPNVQFRGANIYESTGGDFNSVGSQLDLEAVGGVLGDDFAATRRGVWDRESSVVVVMGNGSFSSSTEAEVLAGANRIAIGSNATGYEVIGFVTATELETNVWELTTLIRGIRGLPVDHSQGEDVIVLDDSIGIRTMNSGAIGETRNIKAVTPNEDEALFPDEEITITGGISAPLPPSGLRAFKDSGDAVFKWGRTSRLIRKVLLQPVTTYSMENEYILEIMNGASVVRTFEVTGEEQTYTAAEQATDGQSSPFTVRLTRKDMTFGNSPTIEEVVNAVNTEA